MDHPLIIAALMLAGVSVAGLAVDARATTSKATRVFGLSALSIKVVLALAFAVQIFHVRTVPATVYDEFGEYLTFFSLVVVGIPMVGVAIACELAAWPRMNDRAHGSRTHIAEDE